MTYDNRTDNELIRHGGLAPDPLTRALAERLEMRLRDIAELEHLLGKQANRTNHDPAQLNLF